MESYMDAELMALMEMEQAAERGPYYQRSKLTCRERQRVRARVRKWKRIKLKEVRR
jgi:hypothetical protein